MLGCCHKMRFGSRKCVKMRLRELTCSTDSLAGFAGREGNGERGTGKRRREGGGREKEEKERRKEGKNSSKNSGYDLDDVHVS